MEWNDKGFLIEKKRYNENSLLAEIYTENHGKVAGLIFGATSKKIKGYLELGNFLHVNYKYKNDNKIGYFNVEILNAYSALYFENKKKLFCILSVVNLIKVLSAEQQSNKNIFLLIKKFYEILKIEKHWISEYIFWELELLKHFGYDLDLNKIVSKDEFKDKSIYSVKRNNTIKYVPSFLVENKKENIEYKELLKGLRLVDDYMIKSIFNPNNIDYPLARLDFLNIIKN